MHTRRTGFLCCFFSILLLLILLFCLNSSEIRLKLYTDTPVIEISDTFNKQRVNGWYNKYDGIYHFFLPAYTEDISHINCNGKKYSTDEPIYVDDKIINIHKSSNLSSLFISTASGSNDYIWADKNNTESASVNIIAADGTVSISSGIEYITGRGNSTWTFKKKSYTLKFDRAVSLEGMSPQKKWVLLANVYEGTKVTYKMMLDMANHMGLDYTPQC